MLANMQVLSSSSGPLSHMLRKVQLCERLGLTFLILSIVSEGKLAHMAHFDSKAEVEEYTRSIGVPATFLFAGAYMSNIPDALQKVFPPMVDCSKPC